MEDNFLKLDLSSSFEKFVDQIEALPERDKRDLRFHRVVFLSKQLASSLRAGEGGSGTTSLTPLELRLQSLSSTLTSLSFGGEGSC